MLPQTTGFLFMILFAKGEVGKAELVADLVPEPFLPGPFDVDHQHIARLSTPNNLYHKTPKG